MNTLINCAFIGLLTFFFSVSSIAFAEDARSQGCAAYDKDVTQEITLLSHLISPMPNPLTVNTAYELILTPQKHTPLLAEPHRHSNDDSSFAVILPLISPTSGKVRISISNKAWIDIIKQTDDDQPSRVLEATDFNSRHECNILRKFVEYDLRTNTKYFLQLTGATSNKIKIVVTTINP